MYFSLTTTTWGLMRGTDGTSISPSHLAYRWKVEMKRREGIKEEGENKIGDRKIKERNTVAIPNRTCNVIWKHNISTIVLGFCRGRSSFFSCLLFIFLSSNLSSSLFDQLKSSFSNPFLYKFIVLGFLGLSPSSCWARNPNRVLPIGAVCGNYWCNSKLDTERW